MPAGYGGQAIGGTRSRDALGGYGGGGTVSGRTGGSGLGGALSGAVRGAAYGSMLGAPGAIVGGLAGALLGGGGLSMGSGSRSGSMAPRGDAGRSGDKTIMPTVPPAAPIANPVPSLATALQRYTRPDEAKAPGWMRFDPVMSPLQRRSYIATQGISGEQGLYRSKEAKDYYSNLLARTLIGPTGELGDYNQLLPIEMQYLQALGIPGWNDTKGLLGGLGIQPGMGIS